MTDLRSVPDDPCDDRELWDLVAAVPVPAAAPDFRSRLGTRLAAAALAAPASGHHAVAEAAMPGTPARLRRRFPTRLFIAAATVTAAAAIIAFAVMPALRGTETATAADMLASMNSAGGGVRIVRLHVVEGVIPVTSPSPSAGSLASAPGTLDKIAPVMKDTTTQLVLAANGDYLATQRWWSAGSQAEWITSVYGYDESRHELRINSINNGDGIEVLHPAGPTDFPNIDVFYLRYQAQADSVRAQLAEADPNTPVMETMYLGRPAWRAKLPGELGTPGTTVTVDQGTGLVMATQRLEGAPGGSRAVSRMRVTRLEIDPQLPEGWNVVPLLKRTTEKLQWNYFWDEGTRFGTPEAIATRAWPTLPLIPQRVPTGYRLADVASVAYNDVRPAHMRDNARHYVGDGDGPKGSHPGTMVTRRIALRRSKQGVRVLFRRGFDRFVVEISPRLPGEPGMGQLDQESRPTMEDVTLTAGYLQGQRARTWISSAYLPFSHIGGNSMLTSGDGPVLVTYSARSMITIYGALTRQELIDVANSLKVYGDADRPLPAGYAD